MNPRFKNLVCSKCSREYPIDKPLNLCSCGGPLLVPLQTDAPNGNIEDIISEDDSLWRYRNFLPLEDSANIVSLGEGMTPLFRADELGTALGMGELFLKDEGVNPTGSFKDRGMTVAITRAKELGISKVSLPSAGNAGVSAAAYAKEAGMECRVYIPEDTPSSFAEATQNFGAQLTMIKGTIADAGKAMKEELDGSWFDLSTLKEPYRIEGKKTMGYELAEQMDWSLPDVIVYPTGGGTGLIGMWKAFEELEQLGWIDSFRPKMVSVQSEGCAPIVKAFEEGKEYADRWVNAETKAYGLRVPSAVGDFLILKAIRESDGIAVSVSEERINEGVGYIKEHTELNPAPEGGAALIAVKKLKNNGFFSGDEKVLVFITGNGEKYES